VTSVEPDHLETYGSFSVLREAFTEFMAGASSCVVSADDEAAFELAPSRASFFGQDSRARYRISGLSGGRSNIVFSLTDFGGAGTAGSDVGAGASLGEFELAVPGEYNAQNATAAIVTAITIGVDARTARSALSRFGGVARRFEFRGEKNGVTFVDDYAHLPSEVRAALGAARRGDYARIVCVFQPHRYSRIAALAPAFASAFVDCDVLLVTEIYPAGEAARPGVTGRLIVDAVRAAHAEANATYVATHTELLANLRRTLQRGDCCITLEAGDLTSLPDELLSDDAW
jgi:UDP-N-acetylmuramate--alanine ligase